jgi:hypothetical protein
MIAASNSAATVLSNNAKTDPQYDRYKLTELGVKPEFLNFMNDEQRLELLKSLLYLIVKIQDGYE